MARMSIEPEKMIIAADEFETASKTLAEIIDNLDQTTDSIKADWEGATQEVFYKQYTEVRQYMQGFAGILKNISVEMKAMVERYSDADY